MRFKQFYLQESSDVTIPKILYHGSNYDFSKFDLSHVGKGEGLQKFGFGVYLTDTEKLSNFYATQLKGTQIIYQCRIPSDSRLYEWDSSVDDFLHNKFIKYLTDNDFEEDAEKLQDEYEQYNEYMDFKSYYKILSHLVGSPKKASETFVKFGIDGCVANDIQKRGTIYVIFDASLIKIIDKDILNESEEQIPDYVKVNGEERPTKNNLGEYIYDNLPDIISFWKWFGDSKIADNNGRPILATHSTNNKFSEFDTEKTSSGAAWGKGVYFSLDKKWSGGKFTKHCYLKSLTPLVGNKITKEDRAKLSKYVGREVETLPILTLEKRGGDLISGLVLAGFDSFIGDGPGSTGLHIVIPNKNQIREVKETERSVNESEEQTHLGYKIVNFDGKEAYSIADKKVKYSLKKNDMHTGNIYLGTSKKYATEYYSTDSDDPEDPEELLLTYEFSPSDIKKGNIEDKDYMTGGSEIIVSKAKLVGVYNITKKKILVESEERKHGKLLSEIKPTLKTVMIFRARDDKSDEFESKDYVTLSSKFALEHAESNHVYSEEPHIVIRATVPTNQLAEASNPGEWFYIGPKIHGDVVYKTLGPEDYDGKIIDLKFARKLKL